MNSHITCNFIKISKTILLILIIVFLLVQTVFTQDDIPPLNKNNLNTKNNNKIKSSKSQTYINFGGFLKLWYIYEQVQNDSKQNVSNDFAKDEASGFSINKARINFNIASKRISNSYQIKLEKGTIVLLDAFLFYKLFSNKLSVGFGQMKIPSTYEVLTADTNLDFATRSIISSRIVDWSLSKSISSVSPFTGINCYNRDMGIAAKGQLSSFFNYFIMIGNGFGANNFIGGEENSQTIYSNRFGEYLYAARICLDIIKLINIKSIISSFTISGHYNHNYHHDILYNDTNTVLDIKRNSWSTDLKISLFNRLHFTMLYAKGIINDDTDNDNKTDFTYDGYDLNFIADITRNKLQAAFRYETYTEKNSIFSGTDSIIHYTLGFNYCTSTNLKLKLNYKLKYLKSNLNNDFDNNIFILLLQYQFNSNT